MTRSFFPKRAVHLDFHTMPGVYDVGRDFDPEEFARTLHEASIDYITVFAKCNLGFAYYPTQVGIVHPGLKTDLLGPMVSACHKYGIQITAYLNTGLDHEHALRHRDWCRLNANGQVYEVQTMGHFFRKMCLNTGWAPHLLAMVEEVLDWYPVDGIFLDCFTVTPCYGVECLEGMKELGLDVADAAQAQDFCWRVTQRFTEDVERLVQRKRPHIKVYFNGLPYRTQPTHVELEVLPTGGWGYDYLPWAIRYARTLGKPYFTMTGRFHMSWGDFGGIRPYHALLFDCYDSIANGGTCSVGDHMHPRGKLEPEVYKLIGQVYERTKELDPWAEGARSVTEIAVIVPTISYHPQAGFERASVAGASRMLMELKQQFDVCDGEADLSRYKILILPDDVLVTEPLKHKLQEHLARGGVIISSAFAGLNPDKSAFALPEYGVAYEGPETHDPSFFTTESGVERDIPAMPITIYTPGIAMRAREGSKVLARLHKPYFNKGCWDWRHENMYMPPEMDSGRPALVQHGHICHFSFPIFKGYFEHAVVAYRTLLGNCIESVLPKPLVKVGNVPSFGQVTVTQQDTRRMVHILTYLPELRGQKLQMIEEPITVEGIGLALRNDGHKVKRVYLAPAREALAFHAEGDYIHVTVPKVRGYQIVVFEAE